MKVLNVISWQDRSGGSRAAALLGESLKSHGIEVAWLGANESNNLDEFNSGIRSNKFGHRLLQRAIRAIETTFAIPGLINFADLQATKTLGPLSKIDIVHIHVTHVARLGWPLLSWIGKNYPVVWTLHDMWPITGNCIYPMDCNKWRTLCNRCPQLNNYPKLRFDTTRILHFLKRRLISEIKPHFVAPSRWILDMASREIADLGASISLIPHGVDCTVFKYSDPELSRQLLDIPRSVPFILVPTARMDDPRKGGRFLEQLIEKLNEWGIHAWVGIIKSGIDKAVINHPELGESVTVMELPFVHTDGAMCDYYSAASVSVSFSEVESFGLSVAESVACGCPVVAFSAPGVDERLSDSRLGRLINRGDWVSFIDAVRVYSSYDENARKLIASAACDALSQSHLAERHIGLYNSILAKRMRRPDGSRGS